MGKVLSKIDISNYEEMRQDVIEFLETERNEEEALQESSSFKMVLWAKKYDDWFLDPVVGFLIPGIGDVLSSIAIFPALYVAIFKLHSIKLFLAILYGAMLDLLVGVLPFAGDFVDAFYKSNKIAARLLVGYVEGDEEVDSEINKRAVFAVGLLIVVSIVIYAFYSLIVKVYNWLSELMPSIF